MNKTNLVLDEKPITFEDKDYFNFGEYASNIKAIIQNYSQNPEPLIIGIYGEWGSGKTSFLNLIEKNIEVFEKGDDLNPLIKFHYNPWVYDNKEEMLFDFFDTLSKKLDLSSDGFIKKAGKAIKRYSKYLKSIKLAATVGFPKLGSIGVSVEPYEILQTLGDDLGGKADTLELMKVEIDDLMIKAKRKVVVFIDDIDRLDKEETFTLLKLVKVNAHFKNIVFILCLDPKQVSKAIKARFGKTTVGLGFLEKIVNIPVSIPLIEKEDLDIFLSEKIELALNNVIIDSKEKLELISSLRADAFDTPREAIRVINSYAVSMTSLGKEINPHDLFWLEYLKTKYFPAYIYLKDYVRKMYQSEHFSSVVTLSDDILIDYNKTDSPREKIKTLYPEAFDVIKILFPTKIDMLESEYAERLLRDKRINSRSHTSKYFSFHTKNKVSEQKFSNLISNLTDLNANELLKDILVDTDERKIIFRLVSELSAERRNQIATFLFRNINLFSKEEKHNIITKVSTRIYDEKDDVLEPLAVELSSYLNFNDNQYFLKIFMIDSEKKFLSRLKEIQLNKVVESKVGAFYVNSRFSILTMTIWAEKDELAFSRYIIKSFSSKKRIIEFLRCFTRLWNGNINGCFFNNHYKDLEKKFKLDLDGIFNVIQKFFPKESKSEVLKDDSINWDDFSNNTDTNIVKQFCYWHLKNK